MTPSFSPSIGSEKRLKASLISPSSCAETLCSFASLERGAALVVVLVEALPPDLRFGGWEMLLACLGRRMRKLTMALEAMRCDICGMTMLGAKGMLLVFTDVDVTIGVSKYSARG